MPALAIAIANAFELPKERIPLYQVILWPFYTHWNFDLVMFGVLVGGFFGFLIR